MILGGCALRRRRGRAERRLSRFPGPPADLPKLVEEPVGKWNAFSLVGSRWGLAVSATPPARRPAGQAQGCGEETGPVPGPPLSPLSAQRLCWPSPGSASASASKLPGKQRGNGLLSARNRLLRFQSGFKGHRKRHSCIYTPKIPPDSFGRASLLSCDQLTSITTTARAAAAHFCLEASLVVWGFFPESLFIIIRMQQEEKPLAFAGSMRLNGIDIHFQDMFVSCIDLAPTAPFFARIFQLRGPLRQLWVKISVRQIILMRL